MFETIKSEVRSNAKASRFRVRDEVESALEKGTFRLTDAWAAGQPWSVFVNEVLTDTVGTKAEQFSLQHGLRIRLYVVHPVTLSTTRRGERSLSVPGETVYRDVLRRLERGHVVLAVQDAINALVEHGVGVADRARTKRRDGQPMGCIVEVGYEWQGVLRDTTSPDLQADIAARTKESEQWFAEDALRQSRERAAREAVARANMPVHAAVAQDGQAIASANDDAINRMIEEKLAALLGPVAEAVRGTPGEEKLREALAPTKKKTKADEPAKA